LEDKDKAVVILPMSSIEQHGLHLPVFTDSIIAQEILITRYSGAMMDVRALTRPIVEALDMCGVNAQFSDRNDLLLDGKGISGVAQSIKGKRMMYHGTLLFHSDLDAISQALKVRDDQIQSRSVKSVRSQVTNMCDHYPDLTIEGFKSNLLELLVESSDAEIVELTKEERAAIQDLREKKFSTWDWIYGKSPECDIEKKRQIKGGELCLHLHVKKGCITSLQITGDSVNASELVDIEKCL
jgi:lipoate-protein ligase A